MPKAMLDGNVDYTLNISPYKPDTQYNISYIFDTSASMDAGELQTAKNAYTDLTNYFINNGLAENINFGVVKFSRNATLYENLTAQQAISTIQGLTSSPAIEGTKYNDALYQGLNFFSQSPLKGTTNIAYFVSDGRSQTNFADPSDVSYVYDAQNLRRVSNVQAFGIYDPTDPGGVTSSQINFVDSNNGVLVNGVSQLSTELQKSGLAGNVTAVNILVDGVVVDTIQSSQLTDSPLGLTYEGSVENLNVSANAENVITAEVVFNNNTATTSVDYTVTAGDGKLTDGSGNPIAESGVGSNEDPLERIRNGGDTNDDITLGYADRGANGGAGADYIVGNKRDNQLDGGDGNDTIMGHEGNDTITTGAGTNKINGGEGIDTVLYGNVAYQGNNISLRQAANTVSYNNTDTLTEVEYIQFSDVRISAKTLAVVPILEVAEISITEGDSGNKTAQFTFNLSTPAPVDVVFNYSTADLSAVAGSDYVATSGQITIPTGQTSATANVTINGDTTFEPNEEFGLTLSGISGATFKDNVTEYGVVATIANDDPVNYAPSSLAIPNTIVTTGAPNRSINLDDVFVDSEDNNSALTYSIQNNTNSALFDSVTIDQTNRILLLDYQANTTGTSELTVRATDSKGLFVDTTFTVSAISATSSNDTITGGDGNDYLDGNLGNDNLSGLSGDDTLTGGAGVDTLIGGVGNDLYIVDTATDTITENANEGSDTVTSSVTYTLGATSNLENLTLTGNSAINATGNATNNALEGNSANNNLSGDAGNDTLIGGAGVDTLVGGIGNDLYTVDTATDTITENTNEGNDTVASSVTYTLGASPNLENITLTGNSAINATGNATNNALEGNSANNNLSGDAGNDTLIGGAGVDTLIGGAGNDLYTVDIATDTITENQGEGTDTVASDVAYSLGANLENLYLIGSTAINGTGNTLNNTITGNTANNILIGNTGNDTVTGGLGNDTMTGGYGGDLLTGGTGDDAMTGGAANDTYVVDSIGDVVSETSTLTTEIDTVQSSVTYSLGTNVENVTLIGTSTINGVGNSLDNSLTGNAANNSLTGADGLDTLNGGAGSDTMTGDTGNDTYVVDSTGDVVNETFTTAAEIDTINASVTYSLGANLENLTLTGTSAINGLGNALNNTITGNTANNQLDGSTGNDTMTGGTGNDIYLIDSTGDVVIEISNIATEIDTVQTSATYTLGATSNLENLTLTGNSAINATGNATNNALEGNSANNNLSGDAGNDTLNGGAGNDTLIGGIGNDLYTVDTATDTLSENQGEGTDTVASDVAYSLGANLENLTLTGTSAINGTGNTLNNTITGNAANNTLIGNTGNDTVTGGDGNDTMTGGYGNDLLTGGTGNDAMTGGAANDTYVVDSIGDVVSETSTLTTEIDTVQSSVTYSLDNNIENLTLTDTSAINGLGNSLNNTLVGNTANNQIDGGVGDDTLIGNTGNDTVTGGAGNDTMTGGYGGDLLTGGAGNDTMTGGAANDRFIYDTNAVFSSSAVGIDRI
jgi:Ca2+-binding RTX toxin-like protein